jgi:hypothetical protein
MISITIATQWHIRTPGIYRFMPKKYVNEFFENGRIRLSCFAEFAKHGDEEKGDRLEGKHILVGNGSKQTVFAVMGHGNSAYILCGTAILSQELMASFGCDSGIHIKETTAFGVAIGRKLSGLTQGLEGPCYYKSGSIECGIGDFELEQLKASSDGKTLDLYKLGGFVLNMAGAAVFFKKLPSYQHQSEYRFIWIVDHEVSAPLVIECPEARQFCEKIDFAA